MLTTKRFIKEVEKMGLECLDRSTIFVIYHDGDLVSLVSKDTKFFAGTVYDSFKYLPEELQEKLYNLIDEYARTPLEDREEQERFFLKFKIEIGGKYEYLNYYKEEDELTLDNSLETSSFQTLFTDKELEKLKEKFGVTLSDFEKIPVEEDEE